MASFCEPHIRGATEGGVQADGMGTISLSRARRHPKMGGPSSLASGQGAERHKSAILMMFFPWRFTVVEARRARYGALASAAPSSWEREKTNETPNVFPQTIGKTRHGSWMRPSDGCGQAPAR